MGIDTDKLLAAIDAGKDNSYGSDENSSLGKRRQAAIEAYLGLNVNPAPEGRSQVVDRSVYETISTLIPSLVRIFASSSDEICRFVPVGPEDEAAAEQTTAVVQHVVTEQNQWEQICSDWLHDCLLLANGYAMAYWDKTDTKVRETYEGQSDDQLASLLEDTDVTVIQHSARPDEQGNADAQAAYKQATQQFSQAFQRWQQYAMQEQQQGRPVPPEPQPPQPPQPLMLHDVVIERSENAGQVCIRVLPPEHCKVSVDTPDYTLKECPYFEYGREMTIGALRAMGLDVPEDISEEEDGDDTQEDRARDRFTEQEFGDDGPGVMRKVWVRMIWVRCEAEDDEIERLYYVIAVGRTVLFAEPCARIPVASMTPQPFPHRHIGVSVADIVMDIQDTKTAVKRGGLDNLYLMNAGRHVISSRVNLGDFLDARPGGVVRMLDDSLPGDGHVMPLVHPVAFDQIIGSLEYFDQERQNRTGASRYFSGTDAGAINKTASGTMSLQNMAAMRVEHIARTVAPAVEYLFSIVQECIAKHSNKPLTMKLKGQWTVVDPQAWRKKRDARISVGVGAGNKETMMGQLAQTFNAQLQMLPLGLAGREQFHATVTEMAKLSGFANPDKFWVDPSRTQPPPPQPTPEQVKAQAEMQALQFKASQDAQRFQAEQQHEQMKMQMQAELDRNREEMDARQKMLESQQKAELEQQKAMLAAQQEAQRLEFEKWKAELDAAVKLQIAGMSGDVARETATPKKDPMVEQVMQMMEALSADLASPAEIIRGADGRAERVRRGSREMRIVRGPDGRASGLIQ